MDLWFFIPFVIYAYIYIKNYRINNLNIAVSGWMLVLYYHFAAIGAEDFPTFNIKPPLCYMGVLVIAVSVFWSWLRRDKES